MSRTEPSYDDAPLLAVTGLHKAFGDHEVLQGIDLTVRRGEVVTLIGPSGSGKTTVLRCLNGLEEPDAGKVTVGPNVSVDFSGQRSKRELGRLRDRSAMVFQHYNLFPHLSVLDNVTLASRLVHRVPRVEAERRARELLGAIGLGDLAGAYPDRLSGGQQQRVAIVRAIATSPELLLLDEVTSALDPELVGEVLELVRSLAQAGTTIVMATHEMAFARDVADRVVFLDAGSIIEEASAAEFFSAPREERTREFLARFLPDV
jgi:ABC-type polar amino acid transport system ATPase subunit